MADREDSPDWLRSFQAPTRSITTLSSDSEASGDKNPNSLEEDEKMSIVKSSSKKTAKKRAKGGDEIPPKRRKTEKDKEGGSEDDNDVKREKSLVKPMRTSARNHSVWDLSSDSDSDSNAAIKDEVNEDLSFHQLSDSMRKQHDDEDAASKVVKKGKTPKKQLKLEQVKPKEKKEKKKIDSLVKTEDGALRENEANEISPIHELSESLKDDEKDNYNEDSTSKVARKRKSPMKRPEVEDVESADKNQATEPLKMEGDIDAVEEGLSKKHNESCVNSSTLSLILPEKVSRSKALVECEGETIDLSGDMGAVGRVIIPETPSGEPEMFLDLKGTIYRTAIVPSRTFCVVSIGPSEAKIEAIMNDFIQLKAQSNVYDAETMVEGTLEGFSFDSEDEADKMAKDVKTDQNEEAEEQTGKKPRGKVEKNLGATQKKGKAAGGKQPKKRKPQATKKGKGKK